MAELIAEEEAAKAAAEKLAAAKKAKKLAKIKVQRWPGGDG
jgi:hypothetical protein